MCTVIHAYVFSLSCKCYSLYFFDCVKPLETLPYIVYVTSTLREESAPLGPYQTTVYRTSVVVSKAVYLTPVVVIQRPYTVWMSPRLLHAYSLRITRY